ncbi:MAG: penicillin-binding transpeptidase domain-containing protein, partial [Acidobacteriota bacterium]|nr:penicillin-binding transpeptidase domain-containing protein [Acidobacteriota bacterium]
VSATSIQLARICATIANGGLLVQPKLILKRGDEVQPTEAPRRIIKPQTAFTMRQLMEGVVLRGTGKTVAKLDGYSSGGKTGTAQIFDVPTHRYTHSYNASFMGFAPVTNPALIMVVTLNGTGGNLGMGALAAGPVFHSVMTEALRILEVPKDLPEDMPEDKEPINPEKAADLTIADLGSTAPNILEETIEETAETDRGVSAPVIAAVKWDGPTVPNFQGKTMRAVVEQASELGLPVLIDGSGIARTQIPLPGNPWRQGERIRVQFTR